MNHQNFLKTLKRQLRFNQGKFSLILVQCNSKNEQNKSIEKLKNEGELKLETLKLEESTKSLYQAIKQFSEQNSFNALMVCDLESVKDIDSLLLATNNIREEFRKFKLPLVFWVTDELMQKLIRLVPDFYSWAITIQFKGENEDNDLITSIRNKIQKIFSQVDNASENIFFDSQLTENEEEIKRESEWYEELKEDQEKIQNLIKEIENSQERKEIEDLEEIEINLEFCLALIAYNFTGKDRDKYRSHYEKYFNKIEQKEKIRNPMWIHCYLGLWLLEDAVRNPIKNNQAAQNAKKQFEKGIPKTQNYNFDNTDKLVIKFINFQAESIYLTLDWQEKNIGESEDLRNLENIIQRAETIHQEDKFKKAQVLSLLAEIKRKKAQKQDQKQDQKQAEKEAKQALNWLNQEITPKSGELKIFSSDYYKTRCLFTLGDVHRNLGRIKDSIKILEKAKEQVSTIKNNAPKLYIDILESLRQSYYKQGNYLEAFKNKLQKQETENQFGFRVFIGASRLKAHQESDHQSVAQEISDSGRQDTVNKIIERIDARKRLTILYGQSGVGKSSLIEAGLVPTLKNNKQLSQKVPIVLRDYSDWTKGKELIDQLGLNYNNGDSEEDRIKKILEKTEDLTKECLVIFIFDQLEEFFFNHEKLNQRKNFYEFLRQCLDHSKISNLRVILSLREDYLYLMLEFHRYLEKFKQENPSTKSVSDYVSNKENYLYLDDFSTEQAKTLITALGAKNQQLALTGDLIEQLVKDLAEDSGKVRLVELQIVGAQLQNQEHPIKSLDDYNKLGKADDNSQPPKLILVEQYIEEVIKDCGEKNKQIAKLILYLLTNDKYTRPIKTNDQLQKEVEIFLKTIDKQDILRKLILPIFVRSNLVMLLGEKINNEQAEGQITNNPNDKYQLVHDYLVKFIREKDNPDQKLKKLEEENKKNERRFKWAVLVCAAFVVLVFSGGVFSWQREEQNKALKLSQLNILFQSFIQRDNYQLDALLTTIQAADLVKDDPVKLPEQKQAIINLWYALNLTQERNRLENRVGAIVSISISKDGQRIAFATVNGKIKLWEHGKALPDLAGQHDGTIWGVAFSQDGQQIASAGADGKVILWKWDKQKKSYTYAHTIGSHQKGVRSVNFSLKSDFLASASDDGTVKLWKRNADSYTIFQTLNKHNDKKEVYSVTFSPDGKLIASAGADKEVTLWKWYGNSYIQDKILPGHTKAGHTDAVWSVAFSPDGQLIASASDDKTVRLWNRDGTPYKVKVLEGHKGVVNSVTFTSDGEQIASADGEGNIILWNYKNETRRIFRAHSLGINAISFIPKKDKKLVLVSASVDTTVKFWTLDGIMPDVFTLPKIPGDNSQVTISPKGQPIATVSDGKTRRILTLTEKEWKPDIKHTDKDNEVAFSPDGRKYSANRKQIVSISKQNKVSLWQLNDSSQKPIHLKDLDLNKNEDLDKNDEQVLQSVSVSSDKENNLIIAAGTLGGDIKLWKYLPYRQQKKDNIIKIKSPLELPQGQRHNLSALDINFSPNGKLLASASRDRTVKLWNNKGIFFGTLQKADFPVYPAIFNSSNNSLISLDRQNLMSTWNVDFEKELDGINRDEIAQKSVTRLLEKACDQLDDYLSNHDTKSEDTDTKSEVQEIRSKITEICSKRTSK